jgi:hypothetical protein
MPTIVRRAAITLVFVAAVTGWVTAINLYARTIVPASAPDPVVADRVVAYLRTYAEVEAEADRYERLRPYLVGPALAALDAEATGNHDPVEGLTISDISTRVIFRAGDTAIVEATFRYSTSTEQAVDAGGIYILTLRDGAWKISAVYRIERSP